jgi:hypothetical protein
MRTLTLFLSLIIVNLGFAQNPEVYLGDFSYQDGSLSVSGLKNISNNPGYDNQPSFLIDDGGILFSSSRENGETDIALYDITNDKKNWLTNSKGVSEYSPVQTPEKMSISTVSLSNTGQQEFWKLVAGQQKPVVLEKDVVVGYYVWYDTNTIFSFVLPDSIRPATLQMHDVDSGGQTVIANHPGRSLHKIPGTDLISYVDKTDAEHWYVKSYDPTSETFKTLTETPAGSEDMFWINGSAFVIGEGNELLSWSEAEGYSDPVQLFEENGTISRVAISPDGTKIAIVFTEEE